MEVALPFRQSLSLFAFHCALKRITAPKSLSGIPVRARVGMSIDVQQPRSSTAV
jgi:hypothetical protein